MHPGEDLAVQQRRLTVGTLAAIGTGVVVLAMGGHAIGRAAGFDWHFIAVALLLYLLGGALLVARIRAFHPFDRFGLPNAVTLSRLGIASLFAGLAQEAALIDKPSAWVLWLFVGLAVLALVLDGIDGALARRFNISSRFGARFDMEVDALFILLLSVLAFLLDKVGAWVLLIGALRYLFVLAGHVWPVLTEPLPASWRRKTVSVVQGIFLSGVLSPLIEPPVSSWIALASLAMLSYSFAVDVVWLAARHRQRQRDAQTPGDGERA